MASALAGPLLSLALGGVGQLLNSNSARDAEKQQQRILRASEEAARKKTQERNALIEGQTNDTYNPLNRAKNYEDVAQEGEKGLLDGIKSANSGDLGSIETAQGQVSEDYTRGKATQTANAYDDITKRARLQARAGGLAGLFQNEAMKNNELNSNIGIYDSSINNIGRNGQIAANGVRDNGSLLGGLLMGAAPVAGKFYDAKFGKK